jgi:hypothetical protein
MTVVHVQEERERSGPAGPPEKALSLFVQAHCSLDLEEQEDSAFD